MVNAFLSYLFLCMTDQQLLAQVHYLMEESVLAYRYYLEHGKTFRYACRLRELNSSMICLLEENRAGLNSELAAAAGELLEHYTIWRNKWDAYKEALQPGPDTEFAFANEHRFPKQAAALFEAAYLKSIAD